MELHFINCIFFISELCLQFSGCYVHSATVRHLFIISSVDGTLWWQWWWQWWHLHHFNIALPHVGVNWIHRNVYHIKRTNGHVSGEKTMENMPKTEFKDGSFVTHFDFIFTPVCNRILVKYNLLLRNSTKLRYLPLGFWQTKQCNKP